MPEIVNTDQAQAWNGHEGRHWADNRERWDAVNAGFNAPLFTAAGIEAADRVLDIGCGNGYTTRQAARRAPGGHATGVDLSEPMLARARALAAEEGVANVSFEHGDAQVYPFPAGGHDVAISRYGVMFFADPVAAFTNIARALRPGGRLAFICGSPPERSEWIQSFAAMRDHVPVPMFTPGTPGMFSLADPGRIRTLLTDAGFADVAVTEVFADGTWGRNAEDAAAFLLSSGPGRHILGQATPDAAAAARRALTDSLRRHERADGTVIMRGSAWLVTARTP